MLGFSRTYHIKVQSETKSRAPIGGSLNTKKDHETLGFSKLAELSLYAKLSS